VPNAPLRPCSYPGCSNLVEAGRCDQHKVTADQTWQRDPERQSLYGRRWRKIRAAHLAAEPWCVRCLEEGAYIPATDVDHIVDHKGDVESFYKGELQSLCHAHHSEKTATENTQGGVKKFELGGRTAHWASNAKNYPNVGNSELTGGSKLQAGIDRPVGGRKLA
jgi:5-methylcytosine-specific restriction protein A